MKRDQSLVLRLFLSIILSSFNVILAQHDSSRVKEQIVKTKIPQQFGYKLDEVEQALNSDLVVIGIVNDIIDTPAKVSEMFHSKVIIRIDNKLKGKTNYKNIIIRLKSGPVTDDIHGGDRIVSSIEPNFEIGDKIAIFINNPPNDPYLNSEFVKKNYKSFNNLKTVSDLPDDNFWVSNRQVFKIKNGMVFYFDKTIKEKDFIDKIIKQN